MVQRALLAFLFWIAAALLVAACHLELDAHSAAVCAVVTIAAIVAEIAIGNRLGHGWYALLGTPVHPLLRNIILFVWVFAPALAARRPTLRNR